MDLTVAVRRRRQAGLSSPVPFEDHLVIYIDSSSLNFGLIMHEQLVIVLYLVPKPVNAYLQHYGDWLPSLLFLHVQEY
jgi:hypothetical protein